MSEFCSHSPTTVFNYKIYLFSIIRMTIWYSFIKLMWKLQCFNWLGSILWSVIPVPVFAILISTIANHPDLTGPISALAIFTTIIQGLLLVMIPLSNLRFKNYIRPYTDNKSEMAHDIHQSLLAPPTKIWIIAIVWLAYFFVTTVPAVLDQTITLNTGAYAAMAILYLIYTLKFGILFGSLANTLTFRCQQITDEHDTGNFERSAQILQSYQNLKQASERGLLCVTALSTILTISSIYAMVAALAYDCFKIGDGVTPYLPPGIQVLAFVSTFLFFAQIANNCFENFQGMSETLR